MNIYYKILILYQLCLKYFLKSNNSSINWFEILQPGTALINGENISSIRPNNPKSTHTDINENQLNPYKDNWDLLENIFNSDK
jgi:hypothetical protein